jgi:hypothetical protein
MRGRGIPTDPSARAYRVRPKDFGVKGRALGRDDILTGLVGRARHHAISNFGFAAHPPRFIHR